MCRFCVEHGEGERWYLQAKNYAYDLESDLRRREYIVKFISGFPDMHSSAFTWVDRIEHLPAPLSTAAKRAISRRQQTHHFGQPVPLEDCEQILDLATSITVIPCICRMHTPGQRAEEVCMLVTTQPIESVLEQGFRDYDNGPDLSEFHRVDKTEAMQLLRECEDNGLMHSIWTFVTPFTAALCNCNLESGCVAMRMTAGHGVKVMWRGETVARIDSDSCTRCGRCEPRCPFGAIARESGTVRIRMEQCWGCGICRAACSADAISLTDRREVPEVAAVW